MNRTTTPPMDYYKKLKVLDLFSVAQKAATTKALPPRKKNKSEDKRF